MDALPPAERAALRLADRLFMNAPFIEKTDVFLPGHRAVDEDLEVLAAVGALNGVYVHLIRKQRRRGESRTTIGPYNSPRRSNRL